MNKHKITKQELARKRNFNKFRLLGFVLDTSGLASSEKAMYIQFKKTLLENWDKGTIELGLTPLPKYKIIDKKTGELIEECSKNRLKFYKDTEDYKIQKISYE